MDNKIDEQVDQLIEDALNDALANMAVDEIIPSEKEIADLKEKLKKEFLTKINEQGEFKTK